MIASVKRGGAAREGSSVCEADLREVQGDQAAWRRDGHLREPQAQAEAGLALQVCSVFWPSLFRKRREEAFLHGLEVADTAVRRERPTLELVSRRGGGGWLVEDPLPSLTSS
jgi:hypothetical protein